MGWAATWVHCDIWPALPSGAVSRVLSGSMTLLQLGALFVVYAIAETMWSSIIHVPIDDKEQRSSFGGDIDDSR